jgi:predicted CoA-binding protein
VTSTDAIVERILTHYDTITVVGASRASYKAAHSVPAHMQRHGWRIIPVNPHADQLLGEPAYRTLAGVPEQVGLVDVFRPSGLLYVEDRCLIIEQRRLNLEAPAPG